MNLPIGTVTITEAREITYCHTYYAADSRTDRLIPGTYPVILTLEGGYILPMPYWLLYSVACEVLSDKCYSGFGGVNFAVESRPPRRDTYSVQGSIGLSVLPGFVPHPDLPEPELLMSKAPGVYIEWARKYTPTWEAAKALSGKLSAVAAAA